MIADAPLSTLADDLRTGRIDPRTHLETIEARAADVEPTIHSLVAEDGRWKRLRAAADACAERYPTVAERPPLYGVPIGIKDIVHVDGLPTQGGSKLPPEALAGPEAAAVSRLRAAGALVLGKTVTAEFAHMEPGPTRNPHDPAHTPGGSSSGSAAAVAAGLCPLALGTQTSGSVIRPAAFCGIVGFKPTYGRIAADGLLGVSESVDTVGLFTQRIRGAELAAAILLDDWRPLPEPNARPTIGVPEGPHLDNASLEAREAFDDDVDRLEAAGYEIIRHDPFDDLDAVIDRHERLVAAEAALSHHEWFERYGDRYSAVFTELVEEGRALDVEALARARRGRLTLRESLSTTMDDRGIDLWAAPAAPGPAPEGIETTGKPIMNLPWTHAGLPTIGIPARETEAGLPLGIEFVGRFGADEDVFRYAHGLAATLE